MGDPHTAKTTTNTKFLVIYLPQITGPLMQTGKNKHPSGIKMSGIQMVTGMGIIWGISRLLKKSRREIPFRQHRQTSQRIPRVPRKVLRLKTPRKRKKRTNPHSSAVARATVRTEALTTTPTSP
jgi:hypothetical protein